MRNNNPKYWETATVDINVRPIVTQAYFLINTYKSWVAYLNDLHGFPSAFIIADNKPMILYTDASRAEYVITVKDFKTLACIHGQLVDDLGYRIPLKDWLDHLKYEEYLDSLADIPIGVPQGKLPKCTMLSDKDVEQMLSDFVKGRKAYHIHIDDFYDEPVAVATSPKPPKIPTWLVALIVISVLAIASHAMFGYTVVNPQ